MYQGNYFLYCRKYVLLKITVSAFMMDNLCLEFLPFLLLQFTGSNNRLTVLFVMCLDA